MNIRMLPNVRRKKTFSGVRRRKKKEEGRRKKELEDILVYASSQVVIGS